MKVAIIPDCSKAGAFELAKDMAYWLKAKKISCVAGCDSSADLAVLIGGDGFIMKKSKELACCEIPFLAVNFGTLGFLAAAEIDNWQEVLQNVIEGKYALERYNFLAVRHYSFNLNMVVQSLGAVGDAYIRHKARMILFSVLVDGKAIFDNIRGDGVVVATPIGSTAYNLSAGGPIIRRGAVVTPICTHPLRLKSKTLKDFEEIEIRYHGTKGTRDEGCLFFVDGSDYLIEPGDSVKIFKSDRQASFIIPEGFSFDKARKEKLGLST